MILFKKRRFTEYIKGKAFDRKGLGMELALLVLLVVFACSTLLVSSAVYGKDALNKKEQAVFEKLALDEYAERVLAGADTSDARFEDYAYAWYADGQTLLILQKDDPDAPPLLQIRVVDKKIIEWTYH